MEISLTNTLTNVMGPGSPLIRAFLHVLNDPLIVLVDCHIIESLYLLVVSVEYFQGSEFLNQKLL